MSHPLVLEVHTRCWLRELSARLGRPITLACIPEQELQEWQDLGFTHLWLMGVWSTGPRSRAHALESAGLREQLDRDLPGWTPEDVAGSPFAIAEYKVPRTLGGDAGLALFRDQLHARGLKLMLDFVPNHVGLDHPWLQEHPEYFVRSPEPLPGFFEHATPAGKTWIAHGKDPNFPPWTDTAQLDFRRLDTQRAVFAAFQAVVQRCDGVRCDMAMLLLRDVFERDWGHTPAPEFPAEGEFWANLIKRVKAPDTSPGKAPLLLAEAYWDLEARLQSLGFDYTYDKRLYDYLLSPDPAAVRQHVLGVSGRFLAASAHFLENHDEPRAARVLPLPMHRPAALLVLALPGLRLLQEGQLTGARCYTPVQAACRVAEPVDQELSSLYKVTLEALRGSGVGRGRAQILTNRPAWPDNPTDRYIIVVQWIAEGPPFDLAVVNLAAHRSQCYVDLTVPELARYNWRMRDALGPEDYQRYGEDLQNQGLYLDVAPHAAQIFRFSPIP